MEIDIVSVNVSQAKTVTYKGKEVPSAIAKRPVERSIRLFVSGFEGDEQADRVRHGGPDKAVCVYSSDHYSYWEHAVKRSMSPGAFGENVTIRGITESDVCIGDTFRLGGAIVQVTQPRKPCFKLSARHDVHDLHEQVAETGYTGFYLRVLKPGIVSKSDRLTLLEKHPARISIQEANRVMNKGQNDPPAVRRLIDVDALSDSWRTLLQKRLEEKPPH